MGYTFGAGAGGRQAGQELSPSATRAPGSGSRVVGRPKKRWLLSMDGSPTAPPRAASSAPTTFVVQYVTRQAVAVYHDINGANTPQT